MMDTNTNLVLISRYIHHYSVGAIRTHIMSGYIREDIGDVLLDTMQFVERDFILLLDIPKERRLRFIVKVAQETYLQWCEHGMIQDNVITTVDEYAYQDEWRNEGREIGENQ